jgi:hypothetical protein
MLKLVPKWSLWVSVVTFRLSFPAIADLNPEPGVLYPETRGAVTKSGGMGGSSGRDVKIKPEATFLKTPG